MTNAKIILNESVRLMEEGVLKGTGQFVEIEKEDGTTRQLEMPEPIHTFQKWKELGYSVKKARSQISSFLFGSTPQRKSPQKN